LDDEINEEKREIIGDKEKNFVNKIFMKIRKFRKKKTEIIKENYEEKVREK